MSLLKMTAAVNINKVFGDYMIRIAELNIKLDVPYEQVLRQFSDYVIDAEEYDVLISCDVADCEAEVGKIRFGNSILQSTAIHRKLAEVISQFNALVLHSVLLDVEGTGVAFAAHSGTGKTTHMSLWQELLGDKMVVVNGDKPIVRFFEDEPETPYAYGTPWNGKEKLGCNMRTKLKHICFIERSETNYVEKVDKSQIIDRIFNQVYMPKDPVAVMKTMELIDRLLNCCDLWIIHCNMEKEAAKIAYETIFNA